MLRSLLACVLFASLSLGVSCGAIAAAQMDCPPVGRLPNFEPRENGADLRDYQSAEFYAKAPDDSDQTLTVAGHFCYQTYSAKEGAPVMSNLEIQTNFRQQLEQIGAQITWTDGSNTYAKLAKNGAEKWIRIYSSETSIEATTVEKAPRKQVLTAPSGKDYRLLGHMPTFDVSGDVRERNFDEYAFSVKGDDGDREIKVQGKFYGVNYSQRDGAPPVSNLEIQENYQTALKNLGAEITWADGSNTYARLLDHGTPVWIRVYSAETGVEVVAVEEKPFQASIQAPQADALKAALDAQGHVALYVNFDFAKAVLSADSRPVIDQVLALLKNDAALKLAIEGHTDNIGSDAANQKLSEQRAQAVVAALVQGGIAAERLSAAGFGAGKPVADNNTSEGRAKNRRVELVKR